MQPLNFIANYYGENMAFYFAWLHFYTSWLLIIAVPGLILFIYQMYLIINQYLNDLPYSIDTPYNFIYCILMAVWSTVLMEVWKRRQNEISHMWNMNINKNDDSERPQFNADLVPNSTNRSISKVNTVNSYFRKVFGQIPVIVISISIVIGCFIENYIYQKDHTDAGNTVGASIINAIVIIVLKLIYEKLAIMMVNWENHKYSKAWENSLISKNFPFAFVNGNISLFSIAFVTQNFDKLAITLAILFTLKQVSIVFVDIIFPMALVSFKKWKVDRLFKANPKKIQLEKMQYFVEKQLCLDQ